MTFGSWVLSTIAKLRLIYVGAPETIPMPHGLDRLRAAYALYLGEEEDPVPYAEARRFLRAWLRQQGT